MGKQHGGDFQTPRKPEYERGALIISPGVAVSGIAPCNDNAERGAHGIPRLLGSKAPRLPRSEAAKFEPGPLLDRAKELGGESGRSQRRQSIEWLPTIAGQLGPPVLRGRMSMQEALQLRPSSELIANERVEQADLLQLRGFDRAVPDQAEVLGRSDRITDFVRDVVV